MEAFEFIPQGILIRDQWYPVVKMGWLEGELLHDFVRIHAHESEVIRSIRQQWLTLIRALEAADIAHGDLQHGNVLVVNGSLRLVDYDGVFVPSLQGLGSHEVGHPNYQHPARGADDFGPHLDRFSAWVIYVSLLAVEVDATLWDQCGAGDERLLFQASDFVVPQSSAAFRLLNGHTDVRLRSATKQLTDSLDRDLATIPPLPTDVQDTDQHRCRRSRVRRDHVPTANTHQVCDNSSPLPEWLKDHVPATSEPRIDTLWSISSWIPFAVAIPLLTALGAFAGLGATFVGSIAAVTVGLVFLPAGALYALYSRDDRVLEARGYRRMRRKIRRHVLLWNGCLKWNRARQRLEMRWSDARRRRADDRIRVHANVSRVRVERLRELTKRMHAPFSDLLIDTVQRRLECEAEVLQIAQKEQIRQGLRRTRIWSSRIPHANFKTKVYLWLCGIRSAEAITGAKASQLDRLGEAVSASLLRWRQETESQVSRSRIVTLPTKVGQDVAASFEAHQAKIEHILEFVDARSQHLVNAEDKRLARSRSAILQRQAQIEGRRLQMRAHLDHRISTVEERTARLRRELDVCHAALSAHAGNSFQAYVWSRVTRRPFI